MSTCHRSLACRAVALREGGSLPKRILFPESPATDNKPAPTRVSTMTAKHILAAFLGALAIFLWEFVAHMFTPLGEAGMSLLPDAGRRFVVAFTSSIGDKPGMYMFPTGGLTDATAKEEKTAAMEKMMEEMKTKPSGLLVYKPAGTTFNFPQDARGRVRHQFSGSPPHRLPAGPDQLSPPSAVACLFVTWPGSSPRSRPNLPYWNWYGFNGTYTVANIVMEAIGFFCAGIVIALVLGRNQQDNL